jgi:hypothetical protein
MYGTAETTYNYTWPNDLPCFIHSAYRKSTVVVDLPFEVVNQTQKNIFYDLHESA